MLITDAVLVWRDAAGDYHVEWEQSHPDTRVEIETLAVPAASLARDQVASRARISGLPAGSRHFFRLSDEHGNEALAGERKLGMQGTPNFRDFGGYTTVSGRRVKWGCLFRSGQLAELSDLDLQLLASLELELICDFRQESEQLSHPSRLPEGKRPRVLNLPIVPGSNNRFFEEAEQRGSGRERFEREHMFEFMLEINRDFAERQRDAYSRMFREILQLEHGRFLVHCSAGKDRTGFAAAILLLALGVPRHRVMEDYLLTRRYFLPDAELERIRRKYGLVQLDGDAILPMLEVHEAYLAQALASIEDNFGSVESYLRDGLGLGSTELDELRGRYLE